MGIKMIIGIVSGVILLFLAFGFYNAAKLKTIEITRSVSIQAPQKRVYEMISQLNNYPKWSPFLAEDPTQKYAVKGDDGTVGAQYHWEGNKGKDLGHQEIERLEANSFVGIRVYIQKPFNAKPTFDYSIKGKGNSTEVIQKFVLQSGLADAFFLWLFGVKKEMENINEQGLALLKKASES
ncbi:hypothetical protein DBR43_02740 [Pedobacter sp. KBW06]|uniref:SRPBCC family protein n=1 Tax=Pedobacter sp. KBW06 TaxID=2153359 RepID=UPI000F5946A8|nr:SRPBCC family protein [Pedobacter sp. KBW06]RQO74331.1 hypothetical protein DBR43_02740 [Pedobacter sp. KBW06]